MAKISKKDYRDIFNNILDSVVILNTDLEFIDVNDNCTELTGYSREELLNMKVNDVVFEDDKERSGKYFKQLVEEGSYKGYRGRLKKKNGEICYIEVNSSAIYDEDGNFAGSRDIIRDISDRVQMEKAFRESEYKFRTIVENAESIIFMIGTDGNFILSEGKGLQSIGLEPGQAVGMSVYEMYANNPEILTAFESARSGEYNNILTKVGGIYFHCFFSPFNSAEGEITAVIGMAHDVTDRIRREKVLEEARQKAEEADMLKSSFLANMSHEIRTPMNAILGFSALLNDEELEPATRKKYVEIINIKGEELLNLLTDLIDISKIESGNISVIKEKVDLHPVLEKLVDNARQVLTLQKNKKIELIFKPAADEDPIEVITDLGRFSQVVNNLLNNAIKFTEEGTIEVGCRMTDQGFLTVYVKDSGIGIPKDKQGMIFERFRQVQESFSRAKGGTGLGLYIVKSLVEMLGGEIIVESEEGKGSTFSFTIPVSEDAGRIRMEKLVNGTGINPEKLKGKKILIVEDDDSNFSYLEALVANYKAVVRRAQTGEESLELIREGCHPDIVLMDLRLPGMSGLETTRMIKKMNPDIRIIAQTAHVFNDDRIKALDAGCDDFISKPIRIQDFLPKISKFMED